MGDKRKRAGDYLLIAALSMVLVFSLSLINGCGGGEEESSRAKKPRRSPAKQERQASNPYSGAQKGVDMAAGGTESAEEADSDFFNEEEEKDIVVEAGRPEDRYDPIGRRDPFQSFIDMVGFGIDEPEDEITDDEIDPTQAVLTKYEISQLDLVGVIIGINNENLALVEDPTGKGYVIKKGTKVAKGYVKEINQNEVIVEEKYRDFLGEIKVTTSPIKFKKSEERE